MKLNQDVTIWQGNQKVLLFNVTNKDGTVADLSAATAINWKVGKNPRSSGTDVLITKSLGSGIALTATPGQFSVTIAATDTQSIAGGTYYHEAEVDSPSTGPVDVATGKFIIQDSLNT